MKRILHPPTLTATVADAIRDTIFRGELQPGEPLREVGLGESLEVSRGTVREALRLLQDERLVEVFPRRGAFVKTLSPPMATELYTLRALIEPYALHLALEADAYTPEDFERMETLARQLGELEQHGGDTYETVEADVAFHYLICSRSNHQLLLQMLKSLQSLTWLFVFNVQLHQSDYYSDEPSHYEIYEAIRSGDPARAEKVLRDHINAAGSALLVCMEKGGGESTNGLR